MVNKYFRKSLIRRYLCSKSTTLTDLQDVYKSRVLAGEFKFDDHQFKILKKVSKLCVYLSSMKQRNQDHHLRGKHSNDSLSSPEDSNEKQNVASEPAMRVRGVYLHGNVGVGKVSFRIMTVYFLFFMLSFM